MREAYLAMDEAEQRGTSPRELERVAGAFDRAVAVYGAAQRASEEGRPT
jgi:hypothetical protein